MTDVNGSTGGSYRQYRTYRLTMAPRPSGNKLELSPGEVALSRGATGAGAGTRLEWVVLRMLRNRNRGDQIQRFAVGATSILGSSES